MNKELFITERHIEKLKKIQQRALACKDYGLALSSIEACASMQYHINQVYTDDELENGLLTVADQCVNVAEEYIPNNDCVLFYDGFGLDLRGTAVKYVKAIAELGYHLVYVTKLSSKGKIPHIVKETEGHNTDYVYIDDNKDYLSRIGILADTFEKYLPKAAFFYTMPNDVVGAVVFNAYAGKVCRFLMDLTDHAFWLGVNAVDYVLESRMMGASNAVYERGIDPSQVIEMHSYLYADKDLVDDQPLPFDIEREKFVFSGGALYKTLGDEELLYYRIVDLLLQSNPDLKFLYAGFGDSSQLDILINRYPGRVFYIPERPDFYRIMERCVFYLNTYPMFGGSMMCYAAYARKVPLTLRHESDQDGMLRDQESRNIVFDTVDEVIAEANRLIADEEYLKDRADQMVGAVLTIELFMGNLRNLIENRTSIYDFGHIEHINTETFRSEYINRLNADKLSDETIAVKRNHRLALHFPWVFIKKYIRRLFG